MPFKCQIGLAGALVKLLMRSYTQAWLRCRSCLNLMSEGECKKGEKHGQGTVTFSGGGKWIGEFRRVKPLNIPGYDKDGNIIGKFVNGVEE